MKISIIIPVFNVQDYIAECLDSIIKNNYSNFEIICIDDASNDNSYSILEKYAEKYDFIKIYRNEKNLGVADTRNKGLALASGEYIWFVDSDDMIDEKALVKIDKYINQNFDIICFSSIVFDKYTTAQFLDRNYKNFLKTINTQQNWTSPLFLITNLWLTCIKKSFILQCNIQFSSGSTIFEDWDFLWKLSAHNPRVYYLNQSLYKYRTGTGTSLVQSYDDKNIEELFNTYNSIKKYLKKNEIFDKNERFCFIRANDIFLCFLHRKYSLKGLTKYIYLYHKFLNQIHPYLLDSIIPLYPKNTQNKIEIIRKHPIWGIYLISCKIDKYGSKMYKHFNRFIYPFRIIVNSILGFISFGYNLFIVILKIVFISIKIILYWIRKE